MRRHTYHPGRMLLLLILVIYSCSVSATTYTVVQNGLFSNQATWSGGLVPPISLLQGDTVIVPGGFTLKLDTAFTVSQPDAAIVVEGTLTDTFRQPYLAPTVHYPLTVGYSGLNGSGVIDLDTIIANQGLVISFSGSINVGYLSAHGLQHSAGTHIKVFKVLDLVKNAYLFTGGKLTMMNKSKIMLRKGSFKTPANSTATYDFSNVHEVHYKDTGLVFGLEYQSLPSQHIFMFAPVGVSEDLLLNSKIYCNGYYITLNSHKLTLGPGAEILNKALNVVTNEHSVLELQNENPLPYSLRLMNENYSSVATQLKDLIINLPDPKKSAGFMMDGVIHNQLEFKSGKLQVLAESFITIDSTASIVGATDSNYIYFQQPFDNGGNPKDHMLGAVTLYLVSGDTVFAPVGTKDHSAPMKIAMPQVGGTGIYRPRMLISASAGVRVYGNSGAYITDTRPAVDHAWVISFFSMTIPGDSLHVELMWKEAAEVNGFNRDSACFSLADYSSRVITKKFDSTGEYKTVAKNAMGYYSIGRKLVAAPQSGLLGYFEYLAVFDSKTFLSVPNTLNKTEVIRVYPNPAGGVLRVDLREGVEKVRAVIYNAAGHQVGSTVVDGVDNIINTSALPAGMYFLRLQGATIDGSTRFVKQ